MILSGYSKKGLSLSSNNPQHLHKEEREEIEDDDLPQRIIEREKDCGEKHQKERCVVDAGKKSLCKEGENGKDEQIERVEKRDSIVVLHHEKEKYCGEQQEKLFFRKIKFADIKHF